MKKEEAKLLYGKRDFPINRLEEGKLVAEGFPPKAPACQSLADRDLPLGDTLRVQGRKNGETPRKAQATKSQKEQKVRKFLFENQKRLWGSHHGYPIIFTKPYLSNSGDQTFAVYLLKL